MTLTAFAAPAKIGAVAAVATLAALSMSRPAHAQATFTFTGTGDSDVIDITTNSGQSWQSIYAGRYQGSLTTGSDTSSIDVLCTDATHEIVGGDSYAANLDYSLTAAAGPLSGGYYQGGLASAMTAADYGSVYNTGSLTAQQRASAVAYLADTYLPAPDAAFAGGATGNTSVNDNMAAMQLSVWDIIQDGGDGLAQGDFQVDGTAQSSLGSLVAYYENQAIANDSYTSSTAAWLQAPVSGDYSHLQSFATIQPNVNVAPAPVPEPGVFVTGASLAGMTGLGLLRGRRRRRSLAPASETVVA